MDVLKYKILVLIFLVMITFIVFYKVVEGFDDNFNNYSNTLQNSYLNNSVRTRYNDVFAFYKGKGSYKKEKMDDNNSDDKISLLNELLDKLLNKVVNDTQDCVGSFGKYSECNKSCGSGGHQIRKYKITQKRGENGKACRYEEGEEEKIPCHIRDCDINDECENNIDCITKNCDPSNNKCGPKVECTKDTVHVCNQDECRRLNEEYGNASHVLEGKYLYELTDEKCFFKTPAEIEELNINIYSYNYENPDSYSADQICTYYQKKNNIGLCENINENIVLEDRNPTCKRGFGPEPTILNIENACETCIINDHTEGTPCECSGNSFLDDDNKCNPQPSWNGGGLSEAQCHWYQIKENGICVDCPTDSGQVTKTGHQTLCGNLENKNRRDINCDNIMTPDSPNENSQCNSNICSDTNVFNGSWNPDDGLLCTFNIEVEECPAGYYKENINDDNCEMCPKGSYCPGNDNSCDQVNQSSNPGRCLCPLNTYSNSYGAIDEHVCTPCPSNKKSIQGSDEEGCDICEPNEISISELDECITGCQNRIITDPVGEGPCVRCDSASGHWHQHTRGKYYCRENSVMIQDNEGGNENFIDSVTNKDILGEYYYDRDEERRDPIILPQEGCNINYPFRQTNSRSPSYLSNFYSTNANTINSGESCIIQSIDDNKCKLKCHNTKKGYSLSRGTYPIRVINRCGGEVQEHCMDRADNYDIQADDNILGDCVSNGRGRYKLKCANIDLQYNHTHWLNEHGLIQECQDQDHCNRYHSNNEECISKGDQNIKYKYCSEAHENYNVSNGIVGGQKHSSCPSSAPIGARYQYPGAGNHTQCDEYHPTDMVTCNSLYESISFDAPHSHQEGSKLLRRCVQPNDGTSATDSFWGNDWNDKSSIGRNTWDNHCMSYTTVTSSNTCYNEGDLNYSRDVYVIP